MTLTTCFFCFGGSLVSRLTRFHITLTFAVLYLWCLALFFTSTPRCFNSVQSFPLSHFNPYASAACCRASSIPLTDPTQIELTSSIYEIGMNLFVVSLSLKPSLLFSFFSNPSSASFTTADIYTVNRAGLSGSVQTESSFFTEYSLWICKNGVKTLPLTYFGYFIAY